MYCPKCSQQQISDEMRFCSRCGFPLGGVRQLIVSSDAAEGGALVNPYYRAFRGMRQGMWWMLAAFPLLFFIGLLTAVDDDFAVFILLPLLLFVIGFIRMLYGGFIQGRKARTKSETSSSLSSGMPAPGAELPPARVAPVSNFAPPRMQTSEIIQPPSVTENTTRLLDDEAAQREN